MLLRAPRAPAAILLVLTRLQARSRGPVGRCAGVTMRPGFPIAILPGIVAELGRVFDLPLRDVGAKAAERFVVGERTPGDGIMAVTEPEESAKAHDGIADATGHLVDDNMIDLADVLAVSPIHLRSLDVFAR